jgi:tRNA A37 threonylcarbamoyladenosine dehydratase
MRTELKKAGVEKLDVLVSDAPVIKPTQIDDDGKKTVGSVSFVPSVAGLICAQHVINTILEN